jgi:hypothetical protein
MNTSAGTIKKSAVDRGVGAGRRPLARLADDSMREGRSAIPMLNRVLKETGRKSVEVAAFASSV